MGYLNNVVGYRDDLLASRSIVRHGNYALLTPDGLVKNVIPGFEHCDVTILSKRFWRRRHRNLPVCD